MVRADGPAPEMTSEFVAGAVLRVAQAFEDLYVDAETGAKMADHLRTTLEEGRFQQPRSMSEFAHALTHALRHVRDDQHVSVVPIQPGHDKSQDAEGDLDARLYRWHAMDNFGFRRVEVLPGTVGYVDIRVFCPVSMAGHTAAAAMRFLAGTNAIIFDLRRNGGGEDDMVRFLAGYLLEDSVELCTIHHRGPRGLEQSRSAEYVPGERLAELPAYVLTSSDTFSAAEDFAYNLQMRGRVTVVGETTKGGGHTVEFVRLPEFHLTLGIPEGRAVNPISKENWEGTGVVPDLAVAAETALHVAHGHALRRLRATVDDPKLRSRVDWALAVVDARANPVSVAADVLRAYAGSYGRSNRVRLEDGVLYVWHEGYAESACTPLTEDLFEYEGGASRVRFVSEAGTVTHAEFLLEDGQIFKARRR
jgi:hypothetical protein